MDYKLEPQVSNYSLDDDIPYNPNDYNFYYLDTAFTGYPASYGEDLPSKGPTYLDTYVSY